MIYLLLSFALVGCESPLEFESPQPANSKNLKKFPKRIQGEGIILGSKFIIERNNFSIISEFDESLSISELELDSNLLLKEDSIYITDEAETVAFPYTRQNDSIFFKVINRKSKLLSNDSIILKRTRNNFFVNIRDKKYWNIYHLKNLNEEILITPLINHDDINFEEYGLIEKRLPNHKDSTLVWCGNLTKKQLDDIVSKGGFEPGREKDPAPITDSIPQE